MVDFGGFYKSDRTQSFKLSKFQHNKHILHHYVLSDNSLIKTYHNGSGRHIKNIVFLQTIIKKIAHIKNPCKSLDLEITQNVLLYVVKITEKVGHIQ